MGFNKETATEASKKDLAKRIEIDASAIDEGGVTERDFPDMCLGAAVEGEMAAQMISTGWQIDLIAEGEKYEYRADKYQIRLHNFKGKNYVIGS
ncbi:MAG: hypothetical protein KA746_08580 [Pyrinomonadaceae bacterium]|nr:hypothetical protein [Pyrinomonadaceae bacterium]MBP6214057.1 hypothetical protein [Pyrinomonadaceae bacterium]